MRKGHVFTLEAMGIFAAWMILLLFAWQHAGHTMNAIADEQIIHQRERIALEALDALIQHHSTNPWKGCAVFSTEKKREIPYHVEKKCLEQLHTHPKPRGITQLRLHTPTESHVVAGEEEEGPCITIRRPFLLDGHIPSVLEASACE